MLSKIKLDECEDVHFNPHNYETLNEKERIRIFGLVECRLMWTKQSKQIIKNKRFKLYVCHKVNFWFWNFFDIISKFLRKETNSNNFKFVFLSQFQQEVL